MTKCIGIISYLPDDGHLRKIRVDKLNKLLSKCDELFSLPIIIIAQNWKDDVDLPKLSKSTITIYKYDIKLGITGARRELRRRFLELEYEYLIMLDDDINLVGNKQSADNYIRQIDNHPGDFGTFKQLTLQLFAISRDLYSQIDFPEGEIMNGDFFEDM